MVRVLGTVQDGGFPHAACSCPRCEAARNDPALRRRVASLAILVPSIHKVFLIDATPDIRSQLDAVREVHGHIEGGVDRAPVDGILLTHAHMGHYTGLAFLGFEAIHTREVPAFCTQEMAAFLRSNGPWDQLVRLKNIVLQPIQPNTPFRLEGEVSVTPILVPHRHEYTDTVGYLLRGPRASLLYVPDTDSWKAWSKPVTEMLDGVDVAILDGTFYSGDELPGRDLSAIGHPLMVETMDLLEPLVHAGRLRVYFTHLNHSNPALTPGAKEKQALEARGFRVLEEGQEFPL